MLKIPFAIQFPKHMKEKGNYAGGKGPRGLIVHYAADPQGDLENAENCIEYGIRQGYTFLCIAGTGELIQAHDVMKWGYHAGESKWDVRLKRLSWGIYGSVSDDFVGVEMNCAGKLTEKDGKYYPHWAFVKDTSKLKPGAKDIPKEQVRFVVNKMYGCPTGYYQKYTPEQEDTLIRSIMWLYVNCIDFKLEYVLGHHEVAGVLGIGYFRKSDPGGSLSMPMPTFRDYLIRNKHELIAKYNITKVT